MSKSVGCVKEFGPSSYVVGVDRHAVLSIWLRRVERWMMLLLRGPHFKAEFFSNENRFRQQ